MQWLLVPFGWIFLIVAFATILVPYFRGRADLLNSWTLFLLGSANFVGFAAVQTGQLGGRYGAYTSSDYVRFVSGATVFYVVIYATYYLARFPRRMAARRLRKWPPASSPALYAQAVICVLLVLGNIFVPNVQFVGQILVIAGASAGVLGLVYASVVWLRDRTNVALLGPVLILMVLAAVSATHGTTGRRLLLSVAMSFPICFYWLFLRYRSPGPTVVRGMVGGLVVMFVIAGYSNIRAARDTTGDPVQYTIERLKMLPSALLGFRETHDGFLGGDSVDASLAAIHHYANNAAPQPFHTLLYVAANPMPRVFWPDKPEALGYSLPRDTGQWRRGGFVNWGPGIIGHGFHEGGFHMLVFYGVLFGMCFRFFDELLARQPDNPYMLGIFAAASGQIIAFARGDIGLFSVLILGAFLTVIGLCYAVRLLTGAGLVYPHTDWPALAAHEDGQTFHPQPQTTYDASAY